MAQTILYYPTINIQDSAWLRNAVLYWDEVSSIVPYEDYPNFSPEVLFLQRSGVYKAVYPQKLFSSEFAEDFCNSISFSNNGITSFHFMADFAGEMQTVSCSHIGFETEMPLTYK